MRHNLKILLIFVTVSSFGCASLVSSNVSVNNLIKSDKGPKIVTFINNTRYIAEMSVALSEYGFVVKPIPSQQEIMELQDQSRIATYNEATTRWGISLEARYIGIDCAFTEHSVYHFTLMLIDITNNEIVMVLKQRGSDGPCTTIKPVFNTLAEAIATNW